LPLGVVLGNEIEKARGVPAEKIESKNSLKLRTSLLEIGRGITERRESRYDTERNSILPKERNREKNAARKKNSGKKKAEMPI